MSNRISKASNVVSLEIEDKFAKSGRNKKIAKVLLKTLRKWASVKQSALEDFSKSQAKRSCRKYIKENLKKKLLAAHSLVILFSVIVKLIIEWIIERYIRHLLKK